MCKFDSPEDPNYITLKNALSGAIHDLLKDSKLSMFYRSGYANVTSLRDQSRRIDRTDENVEIFTCRLGPSG
jgi:hypothetical protein